MRLEGSLDSFGLPEVLQLLAVTRKTGVLRLDRDGSRPAAVGLRSGQLVAATTDRGGHAVARRLIGTGLVDDDALLTALAAVRDGKAPAVVRALLDAGAVELDQVRSLGAAQATDDLGELLRWTAGEFSFVDEQPDPDTLGIALDVSAVVAVGRRRLEVWTQLSRWLPGTDVALSLAVAPEQDPSCTRAEWSLVALVDGDRSAADIAAVLGRGEFEVAGALAGLVQRGLLVLRGTDSAGSAVADLLRRQALLAGAAAARDAVPDQQPSSARPVERAPSPRSSGEALPLEALPLEALPLEALPLTVVPPSAEPLPDDVVTKSLVLRLISGVREL